MERYTEATWLASTDPRAALDAAATARVEREALVLAACACARVALVHAPPDDLARRQVEAAEAWTRGGAAPTAEWARAGQRSDVVTHVRAAAGAASLTRGDTFYASLTVAHVGDAASSRAVSVAYAVRPAARNGLFGAIARREVYRRLAPLVREHVSWARLAAAYSRL